MERRTGMNKKFIESHRYRILLSAGSIFLGICFLVVSYFVNKDIFRNVDFNIMVGLQQLINRSFDVPFSILTLSGSSEVIIVILFSIFIFVLVRTKRVFLSLFFFFSIYIIELLGKLFIFHPLPPPYFNRYALPIRMPSSFFVHTNFSFPSGHMSRSTFLVGILLFLLWRNKRLRNRFVIWSSILIGYILSMFVSRIYLGEHWLSDVVGGLLLGGSISLLSIALW